MSPSISTLLKLAILPLVLLAIFVAWLNQGPETNALNVTESPSKVQASDDVKPANSSDTLTSDAPSDSPPRTSQQVTKPLPSDPRDWSRAKILEESLESIEDQPDLLLRRRILKADDFDNPILIEEVIGKQNQDSHPPPKLVSSMVANQLLLSQELPFDEPQLQKLADEIGWRLRSVSKNQFTAVLESPRSQFDTLETGRKQLLASFPQTTKAPVIEPNFIHYADENTPNDPLSVQWGLSDESNNGINAEKAWDIRTDTSTITIAVIDSGVRFDHEDLVGQFWTNPNEIPNNGIDDDRNGYVDDIHGINTIDNSKTPEDDQGHGTHVAGIIGATGNNSKGITGVSWKSNLMIIKYLNSENRGDTVNAIEAVDYAIEHGARIVNNSWGGADYSSALQSAISKGATKKVIFTAAAGNDRENIDETKHYPASYDLQNIVVVGALKQNGSRASFSNYGYETVDIYAPGVDILSCGHNASDQYISKQGTSMATPLVSGALAMAVLEFPGESIKTLTDRLQFTGRNLYGPDHHYEDRSWGLDLFNLLQTPKVLYPPSLYYLSNPYFANFPGDSITLSAHLISEIQTDLKWLHNGQEIHGQSTATLQLDNITENDQGTYQLQAINTDGSATLEFSLNVISPDQLLAKALDLPNSNLLDHEVGFWKVVPDPNSVGGSHIEHKPVFEGGRHILSTKVQGPATIRFRWKASFGNSYPWHAEARIQSEGIKSIDPGDGRWSVAEFNIRESGEHELTWELYAAALFKDLPDPKFALDGFETYEYLKAPPAIHRAPSDVQVRPTYGTAIWVGAIGQDLTYQWFRNGNEIPGATSNSYNIFRALENDEGSYFARITNPWGSIDSPAATLTLLTHETPAYFTENAKTISRLVGDSIDLAISHEGTPPIQYKWYKDGIPFEGETGPTLTINPINPAHTGSYLLQISNQFQNNANTQYIDLEIDDHEVAPFFTDSTNMSPRRLTVGDALNLDAPPTSGAHPITYQWFKNGKPLEGATEAKLFIDPLTYADSGAYQVEVQNSYGRQLSPEQQVTVSLSSNEALDNFDYPIVSPYDGAPFTHYGQTSVNSDGEDALQIEKLPNWVNEDWRGSLQINVQGPKNLEFHYKNDPGVSPPISFGPNPISRVSTANGWTKYRAHAESGANILAIVIDGIGDAKAWFDHLTVTDKVALSSFPPSEVLAIGDTTLLEAKTFPEDTNAQFQWLKNNEPITGETSKTLTVSNEQIQKGDFFSLSITEDEQTITSRITKVLLPSEVISNLHIAVKGMDSWQRQFNQLSYGYEPNQDLPGSMTIAVAGPGILFLETDNNDIPWEASIGQDTNVSVHKKSSGWFIEVPTGDHKVQLSHKALPYRQSTSFKRINLYPQPFALPISDYPLISSGSQSIRADFFASPLHTVNWHKDGALIKTETNTNAFESTLFDFYNRWGANDNGTYYFEIIERNGAEYTSPPFTLNYLDAWNYPVSGSNYRLDSTILHDGASTFLLIPKERTGPSSTYANIRFQKNSYPVESSYHIFIKGDEKHLSSQLYLKDKYRENAKIEFTDQWTKLEVFPDHQNAIDLVFNGPPNELARLWITDPVESLASNTIITPKQIATYTGSSVTFEAVSSTNPIAYQWKKGGVPLPGATRSALTISNVSREDFSSYSVQVENTAGIHTSDPATLTSSDHLTRAIDAPHAKITSWGDVLWKIDDQHNIDSVESIRSGPISKGEQSNIRIELPSSGFVSFYRFTSHSIYDYSSHTPAKIWHTKNVELPTAGHPIEISVPNTDTSSRNWDEVVWIDKLSYQPANTRSYEKWSSKLISENPFQLPAEQLFELADRQRDTDGDGLSNFSEYVLETDPFNKERYPFHFEESEGGVAIVLNAQPTISADSLFRLERSADLKTWIPIYLDSNSDKVPLVTQDEASTSFIRITVQDLSQDSRF